MDELGDVAISKTKYKNVDCTLKFPAKEGRKKRTLEKVCSFSIAYPMGAMHKIAEKYGTVMDGMRRFDSAVENIKKSKTGPEDFDCLFFFLVAGDNLPTSGEEEIEITESDLGTVDLDELPKIIAAIYSALLEALPKKKAITPEEAKATGTE